MISQQVFVEDDLTSFGVACDQNIPMVVDLII